MSKHASNHTRYKVGRVLEQYGLDELREELPAKWLGDSEPAQSLRELATELNIALVRRAMTEADVQLLDGEAQNIYRLLTADDVSAGARTQQRNKLERTGVDVDQLERDFVTHQAIYTYLTKGLGIEKKTDTETDSVEKHTERIQRLRNRLQAVTADSLAELQRNELLSGGEFDVFVDVQVYCQECHEQYDITALLSDGCACERD